MNATLNRARAADLHAEGGDCGVGHAAGAHGPDEYATTVAGLQKHVVGAAALLLAYAAGAVEAPA